MSTIPHPEAPWTSSYLLNRLREVMQKESVATWRKSYVEKRTSNIKIVIHEDAVQYFYGKKLPREAQEMVDLSGWALDYENQLEQDQSYSVFCASPKMEK